MPKSKRLRFWWPWFSWRCDECNTRHWSWRGFWYRPSDVASALPTIIAEFSALRDQAGVFSRSGLVITPVTTGNPTMAAEDGSLWQRNNYSRVVAEDVADAKD